jgi:hypothetical protein
LAKHQRKLANDFSSRYGVKRTSEQKFRRIADISKG